MTPNEVKKTVALFDFDGVVSDTESLYSAFWNRLGEGELNTGIEDFGQKIKRQTLVQIFDKYIPDENDRKLQRPCIFHQFIAADFRQHDIQKHQVKIVLLHSLYGGQTILHRHTEIARR